MLAAANTKVSFLDGLGVLISQTSFEAIKREAIEAGADFWLYALRHPRKMIEILKIVFYRCFDSREAREATANSDENNKGCIKAKATAVLLALANGLRQAAQTSLTGEERYAQLTLIAEKTERMRSKLPATPFTHDVNEALARTVDTLIIVFTDTRISSRSQTQQPARTRPQASSVQPRQPQLWWLNNGKDDNGS
jgi:hypothetical protein